MRFSTRQRHSSAFRYFYFISYTLSSAVIQWSKAPESDSAPTAIHTTDYFRSQHLYLHLRSAQPLPYRPLPAPLFPLHIHNKHWKHSDFLSPAYLAPRFRSILESAFSVCCRKSTPEASEQLPSVLHPIQQYRCSPDPSPADPGS